MSYRGERATQRTAASQNIQPHRWFQMRPQTAQAERPQTDRLGHRCPSGAHSRGASRCEQSDQASFPLSGNSLRRHARVIADDGLDPRGHKMTHEHAQVDGPWRNCQTSLVYFTNKPVERVENVRMDCVGALLTSSCDHVWSLDQPRCVQQPSPRLGIQPPDDPHALDIERRVYDIQRVPACQFQQVFLHPCVRDLRVLELDVERRPRSVENLEDLLHRGNRLMVQGSGKPNTSVELTDLLQGKILHPAMAVRGPVDLLVMDDNQFSVLCHLNIAFGTIDAVVQIVAYKRKRSHRVLGSQSRLPSMSEYQHDQTSSFMIQNSLTGIQCAPEATQ